MPSSKIARQRSVSPSSFSRSANLIHAAQLAGSYSKNFVYNVLHLSNSLSWNSSSINSSYTLFSNPIYQPASPVQCILWIACSLDIVQLHDRAIFVLLADSFVLSQISQRVTISLQTWIACEVWVWGIQYISPVFVQYPKEYVSKPDYVAP